MEEIFYKKYYNISTWESRFAVTLAPKLLENVLVLNYFEFTTILENVYFSVVKLNKWIPTNCAVYVVWICYAII
jgi:hypothetical protein